MALYKYTQLLNEFEETKRLRIKKEYDVVALTPLQPDFRDTRILPLHSTFKRGILLLVYNSYGISMPNVRKYSSTCYFLCSTMTA